MADADASGYVRLPVVEQYLPAAYSLTAGGAYQQACAVKIPSTGRWEFLAQIQVSTSVAGDPYAFVIGINSIGSTAQGDGHLGTPRISGGEQSSVLANWVQQTLVGRAALKGGDVVGLFFANAAGAVRGQAMVTNAFGDPCTFLLAKRIR